MKKRVLAILAILVVAVFLFSVAYIQKENLIGLITGYAVFSPGPGEEQTTLMLQEADSDNLKDAYVGASGDADVNFGTSALLKTGVNAWTYLNFNLSEVPDNQNIDNSSLCLYVLDTKKTQLINIHHVYVDFDESALTWNNQPCGAAFDDSGNCNLTEESSFQMNSGFEYTWICWDTANMVKKAYSESNNNISIILYTSDSDINSFNSKEGTDSDLRPYLNITYSIANSAPSITLVEPQDGASYGTNENLALDFSALDTDDNIDSCWYTINSGSDVIITSCANTTIDVPEGSVNVAIYVNDTEGEEASDSAIFNVDIGAPSLFLSSPADSYLSSQDVTFTYTPTDVDLDSCKLWGDFSGTFELNQTDLNPTSESENTFSLTLNDGTYSWNIVCNDTIGNEATNGNKTFYVDTINPDLTISQPTGTKTSRTAIPITFSVSDDSPIECIYNIDWATGGEVIANTTITNCADTTFDLSADGNYVLNLYVNDSAENFNSINSIFDIDTSTPSTPPSSGSGGGGGGGGGRSAPVKSSIKVEIQEIGTIIALPGEEKQFVLNIENTGTRAINKCKLTATGNLIETNDIKNIAAGEIVEFSFILTVPIIPNSEIIFECMEGNKTIPLNIILINPNLNVEISKIELESGKLFFQYSVSSDIDSTIELLFSVYNEDGTLVAETIQEVAVKKDQVVENEFFLDIPNAETGLLKISVKKSKETAILAENTIIYDSNLITGRLIKDLLEGNVFSISTIAVIFLAIASIIIIRIIRLKKKRKK